VGRRAARLSVTDLFVAYFGLGGTAKLGELRAFLAGMDDVLDGHQQDVAAHAVDERLVELGTRTVYCRIHQASDGQEQDHMIDDLSGDERRWAADKRDFVADCRDDIADERDAKPTRGTHGG
jgi:hypothetical protein